MMPRWWNEFSDEDIRDFKNPLWYLRIGWGLFQWFLLWFLLISSGGVDLADLLSSVAGVAAIVVLLTVFFWAVSVWEAACEAVGAAVGRLWRRVRPAVLRGLSHLVIARIAGREWLPGRRRTSPRCGADATRS